MTDNLQKAGAFAALIEALLYVVGFAAMFTLLTPDDAPALSSAGRLAFLLEKRVVFQALHLLIYVVFGVILIVLTIALYERLKASGSATMQIATALGLIWSGLVIASGMVANTGLDAVADLYAEDPAQAASVWSAVGAVQDGLGGGVEIVGGLWVLLVSGSALRSRALPRSLNFVGFSVGMAGLLTAIPGLGELGAVFGLGQIAWFLQLGVFMLCNDRI